MGKEEHFDSELNEDSLTSDSSAENEEGISSSDNAISITESSVALAAKEQERAQIQAEIEAFLASGGTIQTVSNNTVADPPKKPESSYGSQPI